jgi:uncharacterized membrane protein YjgN (DUF898 family)
MTDSVNGSADAADPYLPPTQTNTVHHLEYSGDGVEMALLFLKNILLTIVTLSLYRPWARTNLRRYVWGHVSFQGDRASYTGTGEELFKGWAKLFGLLFAIFATVAIATKLIPFLGLLLPFVTPFAYIALFALATYSGLRYRLSRTKWREIKFGVDKDKESTREFLQLYIIGALLSGVTFGIYYPWFKNSERTFLTNRMRLGTVHFSYTGQASDYAGLWFKSIFFCLITLGFYVPWMVRALTEFRLNNTRFQNSRFLFTLKGGDLLIFAICAYFGSILTLGLASPWIYNWGLRLFISNVKLEGDFDMSLVAAAPSDGSSMGEEAVLDYDLDLGF